MSGFTADWLALREPADAAARDEALARRFAAALPPNPRIVDLGAGTGANARALAPLIPSDTHWLLVEHDPRLRAACATERLTAVALDLADGWDALGALDADAVVASAFLDLCGRDWIARLAAHLGLWRVPFLATLTVDGRRQWSPADAADATVAAAFRAHQGRDRGMGPASGSGAVEALAGALEPQGYDVATAPSDWRLGAAAADLVAALVAGEADAARAAEPGARALIDGWEARRMAAVRGGRLSVLIGHRDMLALPRQI